MLGDSVGSFVLDDDFSTKIRFPFNYWSEDSAIVFGNNLDIQRDLKRTDLAGSFRGCIRNIVINNRLIDWLNRGNLYNIEVGCYHYKLAPNQIFFLQLDNEDLEPIMAQDKIPLCSRQYDRQFNTTRVPGEVTDKLVHHKDSKHIAVYHNGKWFKLYTYHKSQPLNAKELEMYD